VPWGCRRFAVVGIDADEPTAFEVDGFVFGGVVDGDEGVDAGSGNGGVVSAPFGDGVVAVDLAERHSAVGPSWEQFGGGVRPQRPGSRHDCSVQENAGAKYRVDACFRKFVDPAGGLGGGGRTAQDGGPELRRDPGVRDEEGLTCGIDCRGDGGGTVLPSTIEDPDVLGAQCVCPAEDGGPEVVRFMVADELDPLAGLGAQVEVDDVDDLGRVGATMDQITDLDDKQVFG
jgi:hypothetical protein